MKISQILMCLLVLLNLFTLSYAASNEELNFISYNIENEQTNDKISYSISDFNGLKHGDEFKLEIYSNKQIIDDSCSKILNVESNSFYKKLVCEVPKLKSGDYTFVGIILRDGETLKKTITKYQSSENSNSLINYNILENETIITLKVESNLENYQVEHYIPKEIIEKLNKENQNDLIESELNYTILDEDPIIAWNIDESPKTIEYKIKKSSNPEDLEKLNIKINSSSNTYLYLSYVLYILIFIIIIIILKPIYTKKVKKINK